MEQVLSPVESLSSPPTRTQAWWSLHGKGSFLSTSQILLVTILSLLSRINAGMRGQKDFETYLNLMSNMFTSTAFPSHTQHYPFTIKDF